jgi:hypothetical protein
MKRDRGDYGYPCLFVAYNQGEGAVVMADGDSYGAFAIRLHSYELNVAILRSIAQDYNWPDFKPIRHHVADVDAKTFARYVGVYRLSPDSFAAIVEDGKGLTFQSTDEGRQRIFPVSSSEFVLKDASPNPFFNRDKETRIRFMTDESGQSSELTHTPKKWMLSNAISAPAQVRMIGDLGSDRKRVRLLDIQARHR